MAKLIDADVILRYLTRDDPKKAAAFLKYLNKNKEENFILNDLTIAEIVWTLSSFYKVNKKTIIKRLEDLFSTERFLISARIRRTFGIYKSYNISFIDSYNAAQVSSENLEGIMSFDGDFNKVKGIKRIEPN